jgi:hypothetical protein
MTAKTPTERRLAAAREATAYALPAIAAAQTAIRAALNTVPPGYMAAHVAALTPAARAAREALADASRRLSAAAAVLSGGSIKTADAELAMARRFGTH